MATQASAVFLEHGSVLDIGGGKMSPTIRNNLLRVFDTAKDPKGVPTMPDELLYDDKGLEIWAKIIFTPQFYQTRDEIELFKKHSEEMARDYIPDNATMIDLGAGDMRKVTHLLRELVYRGRKATYLALDISKDSLTSNLKELAPALTNGSVHMAGLWGDFNAGLAFVKTSTETPRVLLSLGSVLFNDPWKKAVASLRDWAAVMHPSDLILAGMDGHDVSSKKVWDAYHSHPNLFEKFFRNGLLHANTLLKEDVFRIEDWEICAVIEPNEKRHRFYLKAKRNVMSKTQGRMLREGLEIDWFDAHKRSEEDVHMMCDEAGLKVVKSWAIDGSEMRQYLISKKDDDAAVAAEASCEDDSAISVSGE